MKHNHFILCFILGLSFTSFSYSQEGWLRLNPPKQGSEPYEVQDASALSMKTMSVASMSISTYGTLVTTNESAVTPRIRSLACALGHDPVSIYNYVRNEISFKPGYGVYTGADGCLLTKQGNDWDQCALLVSLLRESGISCSYLETRVIYPRTVLANWLGADSSEVAYICDRFGARSMGINGQPELANLLRCFVVAEIDGVEYILDPGFESYDDLNIDLQLKELSGYSQSEFISSLSSGADINTNYVESLNYTNLTQELISLSTNLAANIAGQFPGKTTKEILFGRVKTMEDVTLLASWDSSWPDNGDIPNSVYVYGESDTYSKRYDHVASEDIMRLRVVHQGIDRILQGTELFGNPLVVDYEGETVSLYLNGQLVDSSVDGGEYLLELDVIHPSYTEDVAYYDNGTSVQLKNSGRYLIVNSFMNNVSVELLEDQQRRLGMAKAANEEESIDVFGHQMQLHSSYYQYQQHSFAQLMDEYSDVSSCQVALLGVCGVEDDAYFIDLPLCEHVPTARTSDWSSEDVNFISGAYMSSALEYGIFEQLDSKKSVSTVRLLKTAVKNGQKIWWMDSNNSDHVLSNLVCDVSFKPDAQFRAF